MQKPKKKGGNKQKQLEGTSEANSKTNFFGNFPFQIVPTGFLSGVGMEGEKRGQLSSTANGIFYILVRKW